MQQLITQYEVLQSRINLHGSRMWQLPFTYLGLIGLIISLTFGEDHSPLMNWVFLGLSAVGLVLLWAWFGAYYGYRRTVENMNELEEKLKMGNFTRCYVSHFMPYLLLFILGIITSLLAFRFLE